MSAPILSLVSLRGLCALCVLCGALSGATLLAGCTSIPKADPLADPELADRLDAWGNEAAAVRVAVAVLPPSPETPTTLSHAARLDADAFAEDLARWIEAMGIVDESAPIAGAQDADSALEWAWAGQYDLLLLVRVTQARVAWEGTTTAYPFNLVNWLLWVWPAWYVGDEAYSVNCALEASLLRPDRGHNLPGFPRVYRGRADGVLNEFQRGWQVFGIVSVPGSLREENWNRVSDLLLPAAEGRAAGQLLADLADPGLYEQAPAASERGGLRAVVAAVGRYSDGRPGGSGSSVLDARAMARFLMDPTGAGLGPENVALLVDADATAAAVSAACDRGPLILYLAGRGTMSNGKLGWLAADARATDPDSGPDSGTVWLQDLLSQVDGPVAVVADMDFAAEGAGSAQGDTAPSEPQGDDRVLILSTRPGAHALTIRELNRGLYSYHLLEGLSGPADANGDHRTTLLEAADYAAAQTREVARFEGGNQDPLILGGRGFDPVLGGKP